MVLKQTRAVQMGPQPNLSVVSMHDGDRPPLTRRVPLYKANMAKHSYMARPTNATT